MTCCRTQKTTAHDVCNHTLIRTIMLQLRPTFSESWYRVADLAARLRPSAQISRQYYRGERWYVVRDPAGNQFHRLSDAGVSLRRPARWLAHGRRSVGSRRRAARRRCADAAGSHPDPRAASRGQPDRRRHHARCDRSAPPPQAAWRSGKLQGRLMNVLFPRIPLWDPDRFLKRWMPVVRTVFSKFGAIIWLVVVIAAIADDRAAVGPSSADCRQATRSTPSNLATFWLWAMFVLHQVDPRAGPRLLVPTIRRGVSRDGHHVPGVHPDAVRRRVDARGRSPASGSACSSARRA